MIDIIRIIISYLIGSISGSMIIGKFKKVDIRSMGSGNAGGTNAFRTQGSLFALGVITIDIFKGFAATYYIGMGYGEISSLSLICGFASVMGHIYPIYHGFKGGKGAGTLIGVLLALPLNNKTFYYNVNSKDKDKVNVGQLIEVSFRKKDQIGLIINLPKNVSKKILY